MKLFKAFSELSRGELLLWIGSLAAVTAAFLFSGGGDILTLIASLLGATALIFVSKGMVLGQVLTVVFAVFYGIISFYFRYYGEMITYLGMTAPIAVMSVVSWLKHPYKKTAVVEVNRVSRKQIGLMLVFAVIVTVAFYFILKVMGNANLIFSTISVTTSFIASYLTFLRSEFYGLGYAANDIVLIILWIMATVEDISYLPMVVCFVVFFVNDIYGFINWKRLKKSQQTK
ncbi:MAG: nicotinamide mononucleotide transporter [Oscillospiraceae bacterium]|nr:nicotinamide mononucleotide transporter [Oscillospiraceae bacterium]